MPGDDIADELAAFARTIRRVRRDRELSQDSIERDGGLSRSTLTSIERGGKDPQFTTLVRIARGFGMPLSELVRLYEETTRG